MTRKQLTPELRAKLNVVLEQAAQNRYSVSLVYGVYNAVLEKDERPQSCASCLKRNVQELCKWLDENPQSAGAEAARLEAEKAEAARLEAENSRNTGKTAPSPDYAQPKIKGKKAEDSLL
jgi:hypothetical protein